MSLRAWRRYGLRRMPKRSEFVLFCLLCTFTAAFVLHFRVISLNGAFFKFQAPPDSEKRDPFVDEFKGKDRMPPSIENMEEIRRSHTVDSPLKYFLTMYSDGLEITWSPDVTSLEHLLEACKDYMLMMLEADVQVRWKDPQRSDGTAIVRVGTSLVPEVTLFEYLTKLATFSNKGIMLNLPDLESARVTLNTLSQLKEVVHAPVWIHANILPGPNDDSTPVNGRRLFQYVDEVYPDVTLCVGWASDWDPEDVFQRYNWRHVIDMAKLAATAKQPITFAIRAVFAFNSIRQLKFLISLTNRFSLYVWISKYDIMQTTELVKFRQSIDHKRVFYNLPSDFLRAIKRVPPEKLSAGSETRKWNRNVWAPVILDDKSLAFLGQDQAALEGQGSWLISKIPFQPELQSSRTVNVIGKVQFLDDRLGHDPLTSDSGVEIFIRSTGVNPPTPDKVRGVVLFIGRNGLISFSERNFKKSEGFELTTAARLPVNDCYKFNIADYGEMRPIVCQVTVVKCEEDEATTATDDVTLHLQINYQQALFYVSVHPLKLDNPVIVEDLEVVL